MTMRFVALLVFVAGLTPQAPLDQARGGPPPVFRSGADLVRFDIRVTDGSGRPLSDLRAEEIEIVEDGAARPILLFQHIDEPAGSYTEAAIRSVSAEVSSNRGSPRGHLYILIFDQAHITPGNEQVARRAAESFIKARVRASDRIAIVGIPGPGNADNRNAIGRADPRLDERLCRAPRDLFVAGRDVGLIENQDIEVAPGRAAVARHLGRHRTDRRLCVTAGRLVDVLEQEDRPRRAVLDDLDFLGAQITQRPAGSVGHADVEAHEVRAGPEDRRRPAPSLVEGRLRGEPGNENQQGNEAHGHRILTRCAFSGSPNMVQSCAAMARPSAVGVTRSSSSTARSESRSRPIAR